ncbi:MAG: LytR C-terminal domain-containing protein [Propionibacteriaceae bacterium]|nr:LytR C-terminal domain-containing protein [Propionibacteriaceae bacterium]
MDVRRLMYRWSTLITLVVLLTLLFGGVLWGYKIITAKAPGPDPVECETFRMTELEPEAVTVNVYNGGTKRGLARRVGAKLDKAGFTVNTVANKDAKVLTVLIVGASPEDPEVQLVSRFFTDPQIEGDGRIDHSVDIIVGSSFDEKESYVEEPELTIALPSGSICLPGPTETPSPSAPISGATPSTEPT